ncbi:MAG: NIPSNAP family protein [Minwuiales bacterium]|nr:NIPSNAP family protein [Minwuiales bacterium]
MIVEERVYTLVPGGVPEYLRLYQEFGMEIQKPILGHMVGYFHTEIGTLNQIVHMWAYDSLDERTRRRAELGADPGWQDYVKKIRPLILSQESKILIPAPFSPNP